MHRVVWSFVLLLLLIGCGRRWTEFAGALKNRRILPILFFTAVILALNWALYIWAVNNTFMLQASLGYYINPLVNVVLGMVFLRERLRAPQMLAVLLAAGGVIYLTLYYGEFPWIALTLGVSFGMYGLIRKVAPVGSLVGLVVETLLISPPAAAYLFYLEARGTGSIFRGSLKMDLLLMGTSVLTAVPLLLFTAGAKRIYLSTVGLMQYISPTGMFLLAVCVYGESFSAARVWTFVMIWTALLIYSTDSLIYYRRSEKIPSK
jgi:chloramphenicol-sensitive protein RarD